MKNRKWIHYTAKAMVTALCVGLLTLGALTSVVAAELDHGYCVYNEKGECHRGYALHYEPPTYVRSGGMVDVTLENEGQWNALAQAIAGDVVAYDQNGNEIGISEIELYVQINRDLDFTNMEFIPLGTESQPMGGTLTTLGQNYTVSGIHYSRDSANAGLVAYADDLRMEGICLTNSSFSGASSVGALVGYGTEVTISSSYVNDVTVSATDGTAGAYIGQAGVRGDGTGTSRITFGSLSINVTDGQGRDLPFTSGDHVKVENSVCLFETDGEDGKTSRETFASGAVAYQLHSLTGRWSQIVDAVDSEWGDSLTPQPFPVRLPRVTTEKSYRVYAVSYCDGSTATYTNNAKRDYTGLPV